MPSSIKYFQIGNRNLMITNTDYASLYYTDISKDLNFLEKNVQDYPASSLSQFLLLYHLKKNNDPRFDWQAKKTAIYLHNTYWIEFQLSKLQSGHLNNPGDNPGETVSTEEYETPELPAESHSDIFEVKHSEQEWPLAVSEQIKENLPLQTESSETANEEILKESEGQHSNQSENELIKPEITTQDLAAAVNQQVIGDLPQQPEGAPGKREAFVEKINDDAILNNESVEVPFVEEAKEDFVKDEDIPEPQLEQSNEADLSQNEEDNFHNEESVFNVKIPADDENIFVEVKENDEVANIEEEEEEVVIPFEPLHTVDYFASQGIRLSEEALNNDQLGKQVKSFTAWLKSMKKLHPGQLPEQNEVIEKLIQTSSEVSNQNANVLTEAMAEVLVKQGKQEKAIEMYQKLSLMNPSKSTYFAAKIESLKII